MMPIAVSPVGPVLRRIQHHIRRLMADHGYETNRDLARDAGISESTLSALMKGTRG